MPLKQPSSNSPTPEPSKKQGDLNSSKRKNTSPLEALKTKYEILLTFLREGLKEAQVLAYKWFQRPEEAFLRLHHTQRLSIHLQKSCLPKFKKDIQKMKADLESSEADQLIQFNVQDLSLSENDVLLLKSTAGRKKLETPPELTVSRGPLGRVT